MAYRIYTKDESKKEIKLLVDQFESDFGGKKHPAMKEAQLEDKYIKPLFSYLNWNIHNDGIKKGREEFRVQTSHKIKKTTKEPDYELWLPDKENQKMKRHLFMEAKDPKYNLHAEVKYIRQAYQYAHSTLSISDHSSNRTRLSLLTDFEEFRLFDCMDPYPLTKHDANAYNKYIVKPFDFNYKQYVTDFDLLWDTFERHNVYNGSLSKFEVTDDDLRRNRIAPDLTFLDDLQKWRLNIARSMFKSNKDVTDEFLTSASQLLINRVIFLKMLTDREIEEDYLSLILENISKEDSEISIYGSCRSIFEQLDKRYNGDIFKKREEFDYVIIENKVFKEIIEALKPEKSLYTLAAMPIEIIGNAYEQFLGEIINRKGRGLSSEQKPEVQKAGGVYYTPRYIVDHIVQNTLGIKLNSCKTITDVTKLKILDPACGSGSFLISVYDHLLEWHVSYFRQKVESLLAKGKSFKEITKQFLNEIKIFPIDDIDNKNVFILHLTSKQKKAILLNNIYGVDVDSNVVEITKFSLSMKALENSNREELYEDVDLFNEKILPDLDSNIVCGNSLVDDNIILTNGDILKVKPLNWERKFKTCDKEKGRTVFDCVIGNPPYIEIQKLQPSLTIFMRQFSVPS